MAHKISNTTEKNQPKKESMPSKAAFCAKGATPWHYTEIHTV